MSEEVETAPYDVAYDNEIITYTSSATLRAESASEASHDPKLSLKINRVQAEAALSVSDDGLSLEVSDNRIAGTTVTFSAGTDSPTVTFSREVDRGPLSLDAEIELKYQVTRMTPVEELELAALAGALFVAVAFFGVYPALSRVLQKLPSDDYASPLVELEVRAGAGSGDDAGSGTGGSEPFPQVA